MARPVFTLDAATVRVFVAALDVDVAPFVASLADGEAARAARFRFEEDRARFTAARGILRALLGGVLDVAPSAVAFRYGPHGKPELEGSSDLRFNVSHSGGYGLFALTRGAALGVDLEGSRRLDNLEGIARRYFSPRECSALMALPEGERPAAFFRCWSRKEAFIKATGAGLSQGLDTFDVTLGPDEPARLLRVGNDPRAASGWWMSALDVPSGFAGALVVAGGERRVVQERFEA